MAASFVRSPRVCTVVHSAPSSASIQGPLQFSIPNRHEGGAGRGEPFVYHAARLGVPFPRDSIAAPPFNAGIKVPRYFDCLPLPPPPPTFISAGNASVRRTSDRAWNTTELREGWRGIGGGEGSMDVD